jgi:aspartyl/glutamyl-tRNA(Asn/Gln) amidotransferase C subunit
MTLGNEIFKIAALARMDLDSQECERLRGEFETITAYFTELQTLGLEGETVLPYPCPRAQDEPHDCKVDVGKLSAHLQDGYFKIPPVLE